MMTSIFLTNEDDLILNNVRQPQVFCKWKSTSIFFVYGRPSQLTFEMEDDLIEKIMLDNFNSFVIFEYREDNLNALLDIYDLAWHFSAPACFFFLIIVFFALMTRRTI